MNLALEEVLFRQLKGPILYLWQNDNTIVVGKNQNTFQEINADEVKEQNINIVRRLTGGGAVYHDLGNLNFSVIVDIKEGEVYEYSSFLEPVIKALKYFNVEAYMEGRNDLLVNGYKISGNAQMISGNRVLHHGTLLIDSDLTMLSKVLNVSKNKLSSKGIKSVKSRVANIVDFIDSDISIPLLENRIIEEFCTKNSEELVINDELLKDAKRISKEKYSTYDWIYGGSPKSDFVNEKKFSFGTLCVNLELEKGRIKNCVFSGDFLDTRDISIVSKNLEGVIYLRENIEDRLSELGIEKYLKGITPKELSLIFF